MGGTRWQIRHAIDVDVMQWLTVRTVQAHKQPFRFQVNPHSKFSRYWDALMTILLLFLACETPFEVAFLDVQYYSLTWWIAKVSDAVCLLSLSLSEAALLSHRQNYCLGHPQLHVQWAWPEQVLP